MAVIFLHILFSAAVELSNYQVPRQCQTNKRPHTCPSFQVILCKFFFIFFAKSLKDSTIDGTSIVKYFCFQSKWRQMIVRGQMTSASSVVLYALCSRCFGNVPKNSNKDILFSLSAVTFQSKVTFWWIKFYLFTCLSVLESCKQIENIIFTKKRFSDVLSFFVWISFFPFLSRIIVTRNATH